MGRGKKTNRSYITHSEWINDFHGKRAGDLDKSVKGLPFYVCHLTLQPFGTPAVALAGSTRPFVFDLEYVPSRPEHSLCHLQYCRGP